MSPPTTPTTMRPIPLGRGLQQGADVHLVAPGSMGQAHNVLIDRAGRYAKRRPWSVLPRLDGNGSPLDGACDRIDVWGKLWLRTSSQQLGASDGQVRAYASSGRWHVIGYLPPWQTQHTPLVRTSVSILQCATTLVGVNRLTIWQHGFGGTSFETWARLTDGRGAVVTRDFRVHAPRLTSPLLVQLGGGTAAFIVYAGNPDLRVATFDNAGNTGDVQLASAAALAFDACATDTGALMLVAYSEVLTTSVELGLFDSALTNVGSGTVTIPGGAIAQRLAVCDASNVGEKRLAVVVEAGGGAGPVTYSLLLWRLDNSLGVIAGSPITVESGAHEITAVTMGVDRTGRTWICWYGRLAPTDPLTLHIRHLAAGSNVPVGVRKQIWRVYPAAAPRRTDRGLVLPVYAQGTGENHVALVQLDVDTTTDEPPRYLGVAVRQLAEPAPGFIPQFQRLNQEGDLYTFAAAVAVRPERSIYGGVIGLDLVTLDPLGRRRAPADALPQQHVWATSTLWGTDGYGVHDVSFLQPPALREGTATTGGGTAFTPGAYLYRARYEIVDDAGVLHVSPWSNDLVVVIGDPSSTLEIGVDIDTTQLTAHGRLGAFRQVSVGLYRSAPDGVVDGVGTLYRLTQYGQGATVVPLTVPFITYLDGQYNADAVGRGFVTTAGGRLESRPPPPAVAMLAHLGRLWLASNEPGCSVWFSQTILDGEAPSFHEGLTVQFTDWSGPLTGLAGFDDKVVAFSPDRIGYVSGQGPTDTGEAGGWAGPYPIAAPWGCIEPRSVISTAKGAYFLAPVGICRLTRSLEVELIGDAVRDLVEQSGAEIRGVYYDEHSARVVFNLYAPGGTSALLVYDERHDAWTTLSSPGVTDLRATAYDRRAATMLLTDGLDVALEDATAGGDGVASDPLWYGAELATPWLRQTEVGGWGLTHVVHLEGTYGSPSQWACDVAYDYVEGASQTATLAYTSAYAPGARIVQQVGLKNPTSQAVRITLREQQPSDWPAGQDENATRAVRWWGMALDAGPKPGPARIDTSLRTGVT